MSEQFTIFVGDGWRIAVARDGQSRVTGVPFAEGATLDAQADAVRGRLDEVGYAGQPAVLALASPWCLCAKVSTEQLDRKGRRRAMAFRLEEHLPLSTEEMVVDYAEIGRGEALGVCGELDRLRETVAALTSRGVAVRHICPAALLSAADAVARRAEADFILIGGAAGQGRNADHSYDLVELHNRRPASWCWLTTPRDAELGERLAAWAASRGRPARLASIGCDGGTDGGGAWLAPFDTVDLGGISPDQAAADHAARMLDGETEPWIDLRQDPLAEPGRHRMHRKPIIALVAAVAMFLACLSAVGQWRGRQYQALAARYVQRQAEAYHTALPNKPIPGNVQARLASERRKLAGGTGPTADGPDPGAMNGPSALDSLRDLLASLPTSVRWRVLDLNIQPDLIRLDGQARSHADADAVAAALRQTGRYEAVEPPKTETLKDAGVSFLFTAKPRRGPAASKGDSR